MDAAQDRRAALLFRRLGHQLGPDSDTGWILLQVAADLETQGRNLELMEQEGPP